MRPLKERPNQRLYPAPRQGHRDRHRVSNRCWSPAIRHLFRGAGEPRPLGRVNLAQESFLQEVLDVPPPIENTMDVDRC